MKRLLSHHSSLLLTFYFQVLWLCFSWSLWGSEQLLHHFMEFAEEIQRDPDYLLHIGMHGPNGNLKFQEDLKGKLEETSNKAFLDTDTCILHKVHTSFKKGISKLPLDTNQFVVNFYSVLSYPVPGEKITLNYKNWLKQQPNMYYDTLPYDDSHWNMSSPKL